MCEGFDEKIGRAVNCYYRVRDLVMNEATRPINDKLGEHEENKSLLIAKLEELCQPYDPNMGADDFWTHCWEKFRRAGIRARTGTNDIAAHRTMGVFDDFDRFSSPDWNYPEKVNQDGWGKLALAYINRESPFDGDFSGIIRKRDKLKKTIQVARQLESAVDQHGDQYLRGIFGQNFPEEVRNYDGFDANVLKGWHNSYMRLMSGSNVATTFHLMMDIGLQCVKPDTVLTDLFYRLGWLNAAGMPQAYSREFVKKNYSTDPNIYWAVQKFAIKLGQEIDPLFPGNPLRELDLILVKYGQQPEPNLGIVRNLDAENPVEDLEECR